MKLITPKSYLSQHKLWPETGKHILATYDEDAIIVYQAYNPKIGSYAAKHQKFGGDFSMQRMSWIKPNFLWMMYRSGWGTKANQEVTLAIRMKRSGFEEILRLAVHSSYQPSYGTHEKWRQFLKNSSVRLQWDPDHDPFGNKQQRRAIQLGLKGDSLHQYVNEWIVEIEDISNFVQDQRATLSNKDLHQLMIPVESVYPLPSQLKQSFKG